MEIIKCIFCKKEKGETEYSYHHNKRNKACNECREYHNNHYAKNMDGKKTKAKEFYIKNKELFRDRHFASNIKRKYGLSIEEYKKMLSCQSNKCLICENEFDDDWTKWNRPCVDHCHITKKVRGILCRKCNISLAYIENNKFLQKSLQYLNESMK